MVHVKVPATFDFKDYFRRYGFGGDNPDASYYLGLKYISDAVEGINGGLFYKRMDKNEKLLKKVGEARYYCDGNHNSVQILIDGIRIEAEKENITWDKVEVLVDPPYPKKDVPASPELSKIIKGILEQVEKEIEDKMREEYS